MITFKQYLTEARSAPLYHSTKLYSANKILADNTLYGSVQDHGSTKGKKVIFFTRSFKHAKSIYSTRETVIFEVDQAKLNQRYKIKPIKNWQDERYDKNHKPVYMTGYLGGNEFEEIVETNKIEDFDKYIKTIYVNTKIDKNQYPYLFDDDRVVFI